MFLYTLIKDQYEILLHNTQNIYPLSPPIGKYNKKTAVVLNLHLGYIHTNNRYQQHPS